MNIHKKNAAALMAGPERHVAFPIDCEGWESKSELTAGIISSYWPCLAIPKRRELGTTLSKEISGRVFHALVVECPLLRLEEAPQHITLCLNELDVPADEAIATVTIGAEMVTPNQPKPCDPDLSRILASIHDSDKQMVVYGSLPVRQAQFTLA